MHPADAVPMRTERAPSVAAYAPKARARDANVRHFIGPGRDEARAPGTDGVRHEGGAETTDRTRLTHDLTRTRVSPSACDPGRRRRCEAKLL